MFCLGGSLCQPAFFFSFQALLLEAEAVERIKRACAHKNTNIALLCEKFLWLSQFGQLRISSYIYLIKMYTPPHIYLIKIYTLPHFYLIKILRYSYFQGNKPLDIKATPSYSHIPTGDIPVSYKTQCSLSIPPTELGFGTHSFQAYIYPDIPGGESLVDATTPNQTVTFSKSLAPIYDSLMKFCTCSWQSTWWA